MGLPIRSSIEIQAILNKSQHALADLGLQVISEAKRGIQITNRDHRDKVYRMILLRIYLMYILDDTGNLTNYYTSSTNEKKLNQILDGLVHLSKSFDGPSIPMLGTKNLPLVYYPGSSGANSNSAGGGPATPGGTVFQGTANSPSTLIDTFNSSLSSFAFYIVSIAGNGAGQGSRTSIVSATWRGSNAPVYNETKTEDVGGITSDVTLKVELAAGNIQLNAYTVSDGWTVSGLRILFQNISFVNPLGPLPIGGTTGQFLVKSSNLDYQTNWVTLTANLITDLLSSATELNLLHGVTTSTAQFNFLNTLTSNVQTQINNLNTALANYLLLSGGTMSGNIAMGNHKITGLAAATANGDALRYEQLIGQYLLLSGGTMSGALNMGGQSLTNLPTAVNPSDAVRYDQVSSLQVILNIGDWNMNAAANGSVTVAHGLGANYKKIRSISVIIRDDTDSIYTNGLSGHYNIISGQQLGIYINGINSTNVILLVPTGSQYLADSAYSNGSSYNRGYVFIQYTP